MTDDLISRMDAVQETRVGPSDEWSRDTKGGYELAATDCMMNVLKIKSAADLSSPLGAVAMREALHNAITAKRWQRNYPPYGEYFGDWSPLRDIEIVCAIEDWAIPLPTHATLLAAAMKLPEVAALRKALHFYADFYENPNEGPWGVNSEDFGKVARTALEARHRKESLHLLDQPCINLATAKKD